MMDEQALHAAAVVKRLLRDDIRVMEVSQQAEDEWCATITAKSTVNLDYIRECTPSFLNAEGNLKDLGKLIPTTIYGGGAFEYLDILTDWRERGMATDLELTAL
jgi:cyclohexanone monooxygenase